MKQLVQIDKFKKVIDLNLINNKIIKIRNGWVFFLNDFNFPYKSAMLLYLIKIRDINN